MIISFHLASTMLTLDCCFPVPLACESNIHYFKWNGVECESTLVDGSLWVCFNENNDVTSDILAASITVEVVMWSGWRYVLSVWTLSGTVAYISHANNEKGFIKKNTNYLYRMTKKS